MAPDLRARFTARGLALASGEELDLFAGAMHYWRIEPARWGACLRALRGLGFRLVETYVPWSVHETPPGTARRFDFTSPQLNVGAFVDAAAAEGLRVIVRPGPHINAELTRFGFPERIVRDPAMQARTARGTPSWVPAPPRMFPAPSYASQPFRAAVGEWLRACGDVLAPRATPGGPIVAVQVDNEMQHFFRVGAFDQDYHPDSLAWWHEWSGGLEAPRAWSVANEAACLKWVAFKDEYTARSLAWVAAALDDAGLGGLPKFHTFPPTETDLVNVPTAEGAMGPDGGVVGLDFYHRRADYHRLRRRALYLAGTARTLPFAPEVGLGGPLWLPPMTPSDQRNVARGLLQAGVRAMSFYMAVDRDRWYGAPLGPAGDERPETADFVRKLLAGVLRVGWTSLRRRVGTALVQSRTYTRLATASSLGDPLTPVLLDQLGLGPAGSAELSRDDRPREHRRWYNVAYDALERSRLPFTIVDEGIGAARLGAYRCIVAPTLDRVDRALWQALRACAAHGTIVIYGPGRPTHDEWGAPLCDDVEPPAGAVCLQPWDDVPTLAAELVRRAGGAPVRWVARATAAAEDVDVDVAMYEDAAGTPRALFVGTGGKRAVTAAVLATPGARLEDLFTGDVITTDAEGVAYVPLQGKHVRMFAIG